MDLLEILEHKLAAERAELLERVRSLSDEKRRFHRAPDEWSAQQQLAHLAEMEPIWMGWANGIVRDPGDFVGSAHIVRTPNVDSADNSSFQDLLATLVESRDRTLFRLTQLTCDDMARVGSHRLFGPMSALQCFRAIYRHDRFHRDQIEGRRPPLAMPKQARGLARGVITKRRVAWSDADLSGAWMFTTVLRYVEDAEIDLLREAGILEITHRLPRTYLEVQYKRPVSFDDEVVIHFRPVRLGKTSIHYEFMAFKNGERAVEGRLGVCLVGDDGHPAKLPQHVRDCLRALILAGAVEPG